MSCSTCGAVAIPGRTPEICPECFIAQGKSNMVVEASTATLVSRGAAILEKTKDDGLRIHIPGVGNVVGWPESMVDEVQWFEDV